MFRFSRGYCISFFLGLVFPRPSFLGPYECTEGASRIIWAPLSGTDFFRFDFIVWSSLFFLSGVYCCTPAQVCVFGSHHSRFSFCVLLMWFSLLGWTMWNLHVCELVSITWSHFWIRYTMHSRKPSQKFSFCTVTSHSTYIIETLFLYSHLKSFCFLDLR